MPGVVKHGVVHSAANIDKHWIGEDADKLLTDATGRDVHVVNDADAAGLAEVRYGAAKGRQGLVIVTTLGTGIGSALVYDGVLVPNSELGHLEIDGHDAEKRAASSVKEREDLSWEEWAERLTTYYRKLEHLFSPELFVVGGGVSKKADKFLPLVDIETEIIPADPAQRRRHRRRRPLRQRELSPTVPSCERLAAAAVSRPQPRRRHRRPGPPRSAGAASRAPWSGRSA